MIKIAGTNGKGSAAVSLANIYHKLGYKTAVYTSPHLFEFNERLKINNKEVTDLVWCASFEEIAAAKDSDSLTYFEFVTLAALLIVSRETLDVVILEIGMGGRLDAVNVVDAGIAFITSIGMDHNKWLGSTYEEIAREKAGIAANSKKLVCTSRICSQTIVNMSACDSYVLAKDFSYELINGKYTFSHAENSFEFKAPNIHPDVVSGVLMCLILAKDKLPYNPSDIEQIFPWVVNIARCNLFDLGPQVLVDVAHNVDSVKYLLEYIRSGVKFEKMHLIFSCLKEKDIKNIVKLFDVLDPQWHIYQLADKRAMELAVIQEYLCANTYRGARDAFIKVLSVAGKNDLIVAFGSFHVAKDILLLIKNNCNMVEVS